MRRWVGNIHRYAMHAKAVARVEHVARQGRWHSGRGCAPTCSHLGITDAARGVEIHLNLAAVLVHANPLRHGRGCVVGLDFGCSGRRGRCRTLLPGQHVNAFFFWPPHGVWLM